MATIRLAKETDIPCILELYKQLSMNPGDYKAAPIEECQRIFSDMTQVPGYSLLVAEEEGKVVGTTVLAILPGIAHGTSPFAVVEYMVVDEKQRSKGIGRLLLEHCMKLAKEAGCYKIMLGSNKKRIDAHRFYRKAGYEATHEGFTRYF